MQTSSTKLNLFPWSTISRFVISYSCTSVSVCLKKAEDLLEGAMQRMSVLQAASGATVAGARGWQKYWLMGLPAMSIMQQETGFTLEYSCCHRSLCTYINKNRSNFLAAKDASRPGFITCCRPFTQDATKEGTSWAHGIGYKIIAVSPLASLPLLLPSGAGHSYSSAQ